MSLKLPKTVIAYLDADKRKDVEGAARCFAEDALVYDENKNHRGLEAIKAWKEATSKEYDYMVEPLETSVSEKTVKLHTKLTRTLTRSSAELDYTFTLADNKIILLDIR